MGMRRIGAGLVALIATACTVGPPAQQPTSPTAGTPQEAPAGAPATSPAATDQAGSLSCAQLLTACYDGHCTTQECMDSCAAAGTAAARSLNGALWGCIRAASCADVPCVESRCPDELAACQRDGGIVRADPPAGTPPPGAPVQPAGPQDLVGDWHYGSVSSTGYYDATTGSWAAPTGSGAMLTITSDGRFEKAGLLQTTTYGCTMRYSQWAVGSVKVQGDTVVFTEEKAQHKMADSCGKDWDKPKKLEVRTYRWRVEPDDRGVMALKLADADGSEQAYFH